jgi:hypothetical protein
MKRITLPLALLSTFLVTSALQAAPQSAQQHTAHLTTAVNEVRKTPYFALGGIGFTGQISEGEEALHTILKSKDRQPLITLSQDNDDVSRLYALAALRYLNHPAYKPLAESLAKSTASVDTFSGCIKGTEKVADLAQRIAKGDYNKVLNFDAQRLEKKKKIEIERKS